MTVIRRGRHAYQSTETHLRSIWFDDLAINLTADGWMVFSFIESHDSDAKITTEFLQTRLKLKYHRFTQAIKSLEAGGYLLKTRKRDDNGRFGEYEYVTCDPYDLENNRHPGNGIELPTAHHTHKISAGGNTETSSLENLNWIDPRNSGEDTSLENLNWVKDQDKDLINNLNLKLNLKTSVNAPARETSSSIAVLDRTKPSTGQTEVVQAEPFSGLKSTLRSRGVDPESEPYNRIDFANASRQILDGKEITYKLSYIAKALMADPWWWAAQCPKPVDEPDKTEDSVSAEARRAIGHRFPGGFGDIDITKLSQPVIDQITVWNNGDDSWIAESRNLALFYEDHQAWLQQNRPTMTVCAHHTSIGVSDPVNAIPERLGITHAKPQETTLNTQSSTGSPNSVLTAAKQVAVDKMVLKFLKSKLK